MSDRPRLFRVHETIDGIRDGRVVKLKRGLYALLSRTTVRGHGAYRIGGPDRNVSLVLADHWSTWCELGTVEEVRAE